ncbi:MAG: hypothetical protein ISS70_21830 [Phycisphaerae bacterium]|nr:hypothetical protein [Phycisphaerae bacterium]
MSWNFDRFLKSQIGLLNRLSFYRKPIRSLKTDLTASERETVEEMMYGFGWGADSDLRRVPETDCISIMVVTPTRILIGAGELTTGIEYHHIANCLWIEGDFCIESKEKEPGVGGIRFQPISDKWTKQRRAALRDLVLQHVKGTFIISDKEQEEIGKASEFGSLAPKILLNGMSDLKGRSAVLDQVMSHPNFPSFGLVVSLYAADDANKDVDSHFRRKLLDIMIDSCEASHPQVRETCLDHFDFLDRCSARCEAGALPFHSDAIKTSSGMWILTSLGYANESEFDPAEPSEITVAARNLGGWIYTIFMSYWQLHSFLLEDINGTSG